MSTIFTDDFVHSSDVELSIGDPQIGYRGRELCITAKDGQEVRLTLTDEQLASLAAEIEMAGIGWREGTS
ncbi:MAG: hypothetical protein ACQEUM_07165 [Pseudomonadota bacterium]